MQNDTTEVLMPLMGEGITEATLVKWLKKPGDQVKLEEPLLEVSTDKVDTEIPSPASGVLSEILVNDGTTVEVNKVIAIIRSGATTSSTQAKSAPAVTKAAPSPVTSPRTESKAVSTEAVVTRNGEHGSEGRQKSSPLVRKIAKEESIDLAEITGTGLHGRITKRDLEAAKLRGPSPASSAPAAQQRIAEAPLVTKKDGGTETLDGVPVRRERMSKMRTLIAEHMVRSVRTSPHVTTIFEIDMHRVSAGRAKAQAAFKAREGFGLTYTPFFVHAAVQAIKKFPIVNVSVDGDDILWKDSINIGVAVAIETGLIVPVIRDAGSLNVTGIARRINDLATRARTKKLLPEDVQGGTFSITNPGMFGSLVSSPIINQPQVAILSVGAIIKRPVVINDLIGIRPMVQVGLTFDHRVVDGEGGARFLAYMKEVLEEFDESAI